MGLGLTLFNTKYLLVEGGIDRTDPQLVRFGLMWKIYGAELHSLSLSFGTIITKNGLMSITNACPLLSVISLYYYCSITDSGLETLTKACKSLKEVSLEGCTKITDRGILSLNQNCRQLRALNFSCCRKVDGVSFNGISSTLTCLDAEGCAMDMNATGAGRILSGGGLKYLNLSKSKIPGNGLAAIGLGFASNLKILHFYKCRFIKDDAIIEISKGCPLLQEWNLSVCFQIGIRGWESIGLYCKNLGTLNVINCYICEAGLLALGNGCKRLSLLYIRKRNSAGYDDPSFFKSKLQREDVQIKGIAFFTHMFETWFKRSFHMKCKSNIELTLTRIKMIKRRRKAMVKYLRSDIAELMKIGLDSNAYGRVGRLYLDQKGSLCYDFVEQFCTLILNHLVAMNDQSECPEECKEAVSSLMYAAARFADLPELRELRSLFTERYGNSLESFVNKEFMNLLKPESPTKDMKIQLMQEIALEHCVEWDPNSLDQKVHKPPSFTQEVPQNDDTDHDNESHTTNHDNGWMIKIQETRHKDNNDHRKDESSDDVIKQTQNLRQRILDYLSRTTSLLSTSRETTTSPEDGSSSSSSDDSTKQRSFFPFRFMPPNKYGKNPDISSTVSKNRQKHDGNKENQEVSNYEEANVSCVRNRRRRKNRVKSHSTECLPKQEAPKGHTRAGSYQPDMSMNQPTGHVHPRLPNYDDIIARFAALRAKS
uniref:Leucine-rich repeat domain, L domain-like protein n=1 Tax=Tanacetum cinerariifolium TaxID=118510 RepID=A0A6L2JHN5_TANCI|nr:leucine-rich repeat domain, L domain-like protein [Tanacetum cinerariifolium]